MSHVGIRKHCPSCRTVIDFSYRIYEVVLQCPECYDTIRWKVTEGGE